MTRCGTLCVVLLLACALVSAKAATAQTPEVRVIVATDLAPEVSLRPLARGGLSGGTFGAGVEDAATAAPAAEAAGPNRPSGAAGLFRPGGEAAATVVISGGSTLAVASSVRPVLRPEGLEDRVRASATRNLPGRVTQPGRSTGSLCGVVGLQGDELEAVTGNSSGCGISNPVRLRVVHGIPLTAPATINCTAAQAFSQWVLNAEDIIGNTGGGVANLRVVASYACRSRNSQSGARLSEHATGNALDVAGIGLQDGSELSVLGDWRGRYSSIMTRLHESACGTFGTVLGPNSDRFHQDHFHFDVASYRSGSYCR